jgi:hypothetical protein
MTNYNNGKIYKLEPMCNHDDGDIYIGSTTKEYLCQRMTAHKYGYKQYKNGSQRKIMSFDIFDKYGPENVKITLIELVNANSKDELLSREAYYIRNTNCINKCIPLRTRKEYIEINKAKTKIYAKQYKEQNKEKIAEQKKQHDKKYYENNKDKIIEKAKDYKEKNKERFAELKKQHNKTYREKQKLKKTMEI